MVDTLEKFWAGERLDDYTDADCVEKKQQLSATTFGILFLT
jgi:hypothetical protein